MHMRCRMMFTSRSRLVAAWALTLGLAACGGSAGGGGTETFDTADAQGLAGDITLAGPEGTGTPATTTGGATDSAATLGQEIAEADLYRVVGDRLYLLNAWRGLSIVDLVERRVLGRLALGGVPREMHVLPGRALIVLERHDGGGALVDVALEPVEAPAIRGQVALAGQPRTSRLVGQSIVSVALTPESTVVERFDLNPELAPSGSATVAGTVQNVHVTDGRCFLAQYVEGVTRVRIVDTSAALGAVVLRGTFFVPGLTLDDEKLDYSAGHLRLVTRESVFGPSSRISVVDVRDPDAPVARGTLALGQGEQLFATRFVEDVLYLVTFQAVDPLWIVDLSDPDAPTIAGELIVPGWSTQLVALPGRLVALGVDPTGGWHTTVTLFDVADPGAPFLRSRVALGPAASSAHGDRKAFGVFADQHVVLVPEFAPSARLAVLDFDDEALALRGFVPTDVEPLRGFPHSAGVCALTSTRVVIAAPLDLASTHSVVVAQDVVDRVRLPPVGAGEGRIVELVQDGQRARVGPLVFDLYAERLFAHERAVAVTGTDGAGRAAYVIDYSAGTPTVSPRLDLGQPSIGMWPGAALDAGSIWFPGGGAPRADALLTRGGRLVVRGRGTDAPDLTIGTGDARDGFIVVDIAHGAVESRIEVLGATVTGAAIDGEDLALTLGRSSGVDPLGRPLMRHAFRRVDLTSLSVTESTSVLGELLALDGDLVFTLEEQWGAAWTVDSTVVASRLVAGQAETLAKRALPAGAYDLRVAGATLYYSVGGALPWNSAGGEFAPWFPSSDIHTLRLEVALPTGPTIGLGDEYVALLLAEESGVLVVRDGVRVERYVVSGPVAEQVWSRDVGTFPRAARADGTSGRYLVALGLGGSVTLP